MHSWDWMPLKYSNLITKSECLCLLKSSCFVCWSDSYKSLHAKISVNLSGCSSLKTTLSFLNPGGCGACCNSTHQWGVGAFSSNSFHMYWIKLLPKAARGDIDLADKQVWKMWPVQLLLCKTPCQPTHSGLPGISKPTCLEIRDNQCHREVIRKG